MEPQPATIAGLAQAGAVAFSDDGDTVRDGRRDARGGAELARVTARTDDRP